MHSYIFCVEDFYSSGYYENLFKQQFYTKSSIHNTVTTTVSQTRMFNIYTSYKNILAF